MKKRRTILKTDEDAKRKNLGVQNPKKKLQKRNITPSKNELPHIDSNVAFEENMISRFNIGIARKTRDGRISIPREEEIQSMRESVQGKPPHKHIDLGG
ncbi:hypothetical protein Tco_0863145 [Tanacetum coccineum]